MIRDKKIASLFTENKKGEIHTSATIEIHIPTYFPKTLVKIEEQISIVGSFAIVANGKYAVFSALSMLDIVPKRYQVDGDYHIFGFDANDLVVRSTNVLKNGGVVHPIIETYLFKGKVPWYMGYEDIASLLLRASEDTGLDVDISPPIIDLLVAAVATIKKDGSKVRHSALSREKLVRDLIAYTQMDSVFNVDNTLNKILGNHQSRGTLSALVDEDDTEPTLTETALLR